MKQSLETNVSSALLHGMDETSSANNVTGYVPRLSPSTTRLPSALKFERTFHEEYQLN